MDVSGHLSPPSSFDGSVDNKEEENKKIDNIDEIESEHKGKS